MEEITLEELQTMDTKKIKWLLWAYRQDNMHHVDIEQMSRDEKHIQDIREGRKIIEYNIKLCIYELKSREY